MSRATGCPLGYDDLLCELPHDKPCGNYLFCKLQSASWEIPYDYVDGQLIVKTYARVYVLLKSRTYRDIGTYEMSKVIVNAWQEAGWVAALDSICHLNPDYDPIPF
jgi:hypothetical protein